MTEYPFRTFEIRGNHFQENATLAFTCEVMNGISLGPQMNHNSKLSHVWRRYLPILTIVGQDIPLITGVQGFSSLLIKKTLMFDQFASPASNRASQQVAEE